MLKGNIEQRIKTFFSPIKLIRKREWKMINSWVEFKNGENVYDAACGSGDLSIKIASKGCKVYGIDLDKEKITLARKLAEGKGLACKFQIGNAEGAPYKNDSFDKIICNCSLEHFSNDTKALQEMNRVLKPNGILMLTVDSLTYPVSERFKEKHRKEFCVVNYYTDVSLKDKLQASGFEVVKSKYYLNSTFSSFLFKLSIKNRFRILFCCLSPMAYILGLASDRIFGKGDGGYGLAIKAKKDSNAR